MDNRYNKIKKVLLKLTVQELNDILAYPKEMVYDSFNFDEVNKLYWPLAVGLGVSKSDIKEMTDSKCKQLICEIGKDRGIDINPLHEVVGSFYTSDRKQDLLNLIKEIIKTK